MTHLLLRQLLLSLDYALNAWGLEDGAAAEGGNRDGCVPVFEVVMVCKPRTFHSYM